MGKKAFITGITGQDKSYPDLLNHRSDKMFPEDEGYRREMVAGLKQSYRCLKITYAAGIGIRGQTTPPLICQPAG